MVYEIYNYKTGYIMGREFPTKKQAQDFIKYLKAGTSTKLYWRARKKRTKNPMKLNKWLKVKAIRKLANGAIQILK